MNNLFSKSKEPSKDKEPSKSKEASESKESPESQPQESQPSSNSDDRTPAELITFGLACFVLFALIGLVVAVWTDPRHRQSPRIETAQEEAIQESSGQYYVPFTVKNTGGGTAESVQIIAELEINGEVVESGEQQIDFLSGGESEEGAFIFSQDPEQGTLSLRAASYKLP